MKWLLALLGRIFLKMAGDYAAKAARNNKYIGGNEVVLSVIDGAILKAQKELPVLEGAERLTAAVETVMEKVEDRLESITPDAVKSLAKEFWGMDGSNLGDVLRGAIQKRYEQLTG